MLQLEIKGGTKIQKDLLQEMTLFLMKRLKLSRHDLTIEIKISKMKYKQDFGFCDYEDCNLRPRHFVIELNRELKISTMLRTLAHEFVHVRQQVRGHKRDFFQSGYKQVWMGIDHTDTPYNDQPWEQEAWSEEKTLYKEFRLNRIKKC